MTFQTFSIQVNNLKKMLGKNQALNGLSVNFTADCMHGLIGPEGAGKTTLMRCLTGLLSPDEGTIKFFTEEGLIAFEEIRQSIAYMPQQQSLYADLTVIEHLKFFRDMYQISKSEFKNKCDELLSVTQMDQFVDRPAGKLSGGMYKKLGLMCALLRSPRILLLDEPTNGVDPISRREFWELLYELQSQHILIIVATAYMDEAERCALVHLVDKGSLMTDGEPQTLIKQFQVNSIDEIFLQRGTA